MEEKEIATIPYFAHESEMARMERQIKRLWIVLIMTIVFLVGSNAAWIYYEAQFTDEIVTVEQESESGYNNYVGNDGDIIN